MHIRTARVITCAAVCSLIVSISLLSGCGKKEAPPEIWGRAEAKEVDLNSKIPGRVLRLFVKEGDSVEKGQLLASIDNRDMVAKVNQAKAGLETLEAQLAQAVTVTTLQDQTAQATLATAKAQLEKSKSDLALAESDYRRFSELVQSGAVSKQVFDSYQTKYQVSMAAQSQAQAAVAAAEAGLLQSRINRDNEAAMRSKVNQSQASLEEVNINLAETEIHAPFAGIITSKYVEEGAMVSTGMPLVAIQDPRDNWVNLKIKETELEQYHLGQTVRLEGRNGKLRLEGKIVDISKKPEFATYRATNERGDNDIITFNAKIRTDSEEVRPGMRFRLISGDQ